MRLRDEGHLTLSSEHLSGTTAGSKDVSVNLFEYLVKRTSRYILSQVVLELGAEKEKTIFRVILFQLKFHDYLKSLHCTANDNK